MFCDEALDAVEAIAGGELIPDGRIAHHLATCPNCAAALGGIWMLLHQSGLASVSGDAVELFGTGVATLARRVAPSLPLYARATALLVTALGLWWWAERETSL